MITTLSRSRTIGLAFAVVSSALIGVPMAVSVSAAEASLVAVSPTRLVDTRSAPPASTIDGLSLGEGRVPAGTVRSFVAAGRPGVASSAAAVVLNVTMVDPDDQGYATVFPCPSGTATADDAPNASSVNVARGRTVANSLLVRVGAAGRVCVFSSTSAHLVVDVSGYSTGVSPVALDPARLVETRESATPTIDGDFTGNGSLSAGEIYRFRATARAGVPQSADAVALNVTAVRPQATGFLAVFPCPAGVATAADAPATSNLNFVAGQNVANSVVANVGDDGDVCVLASAATHLVIDVNGFIPVGGDPQSFAPIRLLETRAAGAEATVDGDNIGGGRLQAGSITPLQVAGRGVIPTAASAAVLNLTAIAPASQGYMTLFPCPSGSVGQTDIPTASNLNFTAGQTVANSALVAVGAGGQVCIYTSATTHVVVGASASVEGDGSPPPTTPPTTNPPPPPNPGPQPPTTGPHEFTAFVGGEPVRWDPCSTITYRVDVSRGTPADVADLNSAIARVEQATGLDFVSLGNYTATYSPSVGRSPFPDYPTDAEVGLTLTDNDVATDFSRGLLGYAVTQWSGGSGEIVAGSVTLDVTPSPGIDKELVWMHELAHLVGLGHVSASGQLMQPSYDRTLSDFGDGDREGLWRIGAAQPCFFTDARAADDLRTTFHSLGLIGCDHADH